MAKKAIEPLRTLPMLKDLGLRLSMKYNSQLQILARDTVHALTARPEPQPLPRFRFLDLPKELQRKILEHTGIVDPDKVQCLPGGTKYFWRHCKTEGQVIAAQEFPGHAASLACFCSRAHSAFNYRCSCPSEDFPSTLFLVSRDIRAEATEMFYRQNNFRVPMRLWRRGSPPPGIFCFRMVTRYQTLAPTMANFPVAAIRFLTSLSFSFSGCSYELLRTRAEVPPLGHFAQAGPGIARWHKYSVRSIASKMMPRTKPEPEPKPQLEPMFNADWLGSLYLLLQEANLPLLTLELRFWWEVYESVTSTESVQAPISVGYHDTEEHIWSMYRPFILPISALKGLKNFYVYLEGGMEKTEQKLERLIMGPEYDATKCGKKPKVYSDDPQTLYYSRC
jgi:hypothetical protein